MPGTKRVDGPDSLTSAIGLEMVGEEVCRTLAGEGDVVMSFSRSSDEERVRGLAQV